MTAKKSIAPRRDTTALRAAVDDIAARLAQLPPAVGPNSGHGWYAVHKKREAAAEDLVGHIRREHGARIARGVTPERMRLHGVSVNCTSGVANMLHAWLNKAGAVLQKEERAR